MPTINLSYADLCGLLGKRLSVEELEANLPLVKCEVKSFNGESLSVEVNADRVDLFSAEGIARALKGFLNLEVGYPGFRARPPKISVRVEPPVAEVRPHIACGVVRGIKLGAEAVRQLFQLQEKLHETVCRRRARASIGVYDLDAVRPPLTYTARPAGEIAFRPLEESRILSGEEILRATPKGVQFGHLLASCRRYPLLLDSKGAVLSLPPIINSEDTKVTADSRNLLVDVTGLDRTLVEEVLNVVLANISERGGRVEAVKVYYPAERKGAVTGALRPGAWTLELDLVRRMSGLNLTASQVAKLLKRMRHGVKVRRGGALAVTVPPYRLDILHPVDIVEDAIVGYGYDRIRPEVPGTVTVGRELEHAPLVRRVRDLMAGFGFQEVLSYLMSNPQLQASLTGSEELRLVEVANPLTSEFSSLRASLLPGLLQFLAHNAHVSYPQKVFECGDVVQVDEKAETRTRSQLRLAAALSDYEVSYEDIQSVAYSLLKNLHVEGWGVEEARRGGFMRGRVASVSLTLPDGRTENLGLIGEVHPEVLERFKLPNPTAAFELDLTPILKLRGVDY